LSKRGKVILSLPAEAMDAVRKGAELRGYSNSIIEAVAHYIQERRRPALRERLIVGYQASAEHDQSLAEDWRHTEEKVWRDTIDLPEQED